MTKLRKYGIICNSFEGEYSVMVSNSRKTKIEKLLETGLYTEEELNLLQDAILNDLYLKHLVETGIITKEESGKPWITYYKDRPHQFLNVEKSLYENYVEVNKDNKDGVAVYDANNDRIIKHGELKQLIDAFSNGLLEYGMGEESRIGILISGSYEEPMCLLSPNKNGSLIKYLDFLKGPGSIKKDIEKSKLNMLFMDEMFLPLEPMINSKKLPVVVLNATRDYSRTKYIPFDKVLSIGASKPLKKAFDKQCDEQSLIINSSGTTGIPKPIVHSNKTVNSATQKLMFTDYPMTRNNFILKSIPSHIGLGSLTTLYSSLISGTGIILNRTAGLEEAFGYTIALTNGFKDFLRTHNLDEETKLLMFTSPMFYRAILGAIDNFEDLSCFGALLGAGSKMSKEELEYMNKIYGSKGCTIPICNGYGQNECAGAVALNDNSHNTDGSAGYPVIGTNIKVVNIDTFEDLPPYTEGRILEKSDSEFLYYEGMENETHRVKVTLPDGSEWFDSKDFGFFDENGFVFVTGRASRVLIRNDFKISMDMIEGKIKSHPAVQDCAIIAQRTNGIDEEPIAYIILREDCKDVTSEQLVSQIQSSESKLSEFEMPIEFHLVENLPYLSSGKVDYKKLSLRRQ